MATDTIFLKNVAAGKHRDGFQIVMSENLLHARLPPDFKKEQYYGSSPNVVLSRMPENTQRGKSSRQYGSGHMECLVWQTGWNQIEFREYRHHETIPTDVVRRLSER